MAVVTTTLGNGDGVCVPGNGGTLDALDVEELRALFERHGFVLFQGFNASLEDFFRFGKRFMHHIRVTPEAQRRPHPIHRGVQTVTSGLHAMNFHADFGQLPNRPDIISFYCQVPAQTGGETFVVDGIRLWDALEPATRAAFLAQRIRQQSVLDRALWTTLTGTQDFDAVKTALEQSPGVTCTLLEGDRMFLEWVTPAAFAPRFSSQMCVASNLFPFVYNGLTTVWEDGSPLDVAILVELQTKATALCTTLAWQARDFAMLDNTRYLHARAQQDPHRKVYTLQGDARPR